MQISPMNEYTCQQCGKADTNQDLFRLIAVLGIGFVVCKDCLMGENHVVQQEKEGQEGH